MNSPHKGQWHGALMFYLICTWINGWVNNRKAGDLILRRAHYDVIVTLKRDCNVAWRLRFKYKRTSIQHSKELYLIFWDKIWLHCYHSIHDMNKHMISPSIFNISPNSSLPSRVPIKNVSWMIRNEPKFLDCVGRITFKYSIRWLIIRFLKGEICIPPALD